MKMGFDIKGDNLVFVGFGAGLSYASLVLKWAY
jgi:3-oxoacyl-[acyl-carrier-protein] synthase III